MEPSLQQCDQFILSFLEPPPPTIEFLTMVKLVDSLLEEVQVRQCPPLEQFFQKMRLSMWPVFQKQMHLHTESVRKLTSGNYIKSGVKIEILETVLKRYLALFISTVLLCSEVEGMVFSNLSRIREEVLRLIVQHSKHSKSSTQRYESLKTSITFVVEGLVKNGSLNTHQKAQAELSFWRQKEKELNSRI